MLHELLVALRGHPGHLFTETEAGLKVSSTLTYFHPCEVSLINQVLELGTDYRALTQFISSNQSSGGGMYLEAVCQGLHTVLDPYRSSLRDLEQDMVSDPDSVPLSLVQHRLLPHRPVLKVLVQLVNEISTTEIPGCMVLDTIYKASASGVQGAGAALRKVLAAGHQVLYKQLLAWLLQGHLYDPLNEFFIVKEDEREGEESLLVGETVDGETTRSKSGRYRLEHSLVPAHISHTLAEKIFFIGESIQLFESDRRVEVQGDVLRSRELELYTTLTALRDREQFVVTEFAQFVDKIRESVSSHLHHLVVEEHGLLAELRLVWDVFLLGRGELFHAFIAAADSRLCAPPQGAAQHDVLQAWQSALGLYEGEEKLIGRVKPKVGNDSARVGWDQLSLQYAVPWPLHLVVTPQALDKYNRIFAFLMLVRRSQIALHNLWAEAMFVSRVAGKQEALGMDTRQQTRTHMTFLVDNLQYYLMADVLDTKISQLVNNMNKSSNFEEVKIVHDQFLTQVQASIFLHNPQVHKCLLDIMSTCLQFCSATDSTNLCLNFSRQSSLLIQLLTSLRTHLAPSCLAQLLTRIDYNRYFSKKDKLVIE